MMKLVIVEKAILFYDGQSQSAKIKTTIAYQNDQTDHGYKRWLSMHNLDIKTN